MSVAHSTVSAIQSVCGDATENILFATYRAGAPSRPRAIAHSPPSPFDSLPPVRQDTAVRGMQDGNYKKIKWAVLFTIKNSAIE